MRLQIAAAYWSLLLGVGWLIPLMPFCTLLQSVNDSKGAPLVDHLYAQATLWDLDVSVTCNTRIPMLRPQAEEACVSASLWGRHDFLEASRIACRLEDARVHQYTYGCERLALFHVAGSGISLLWACAAVLQMCASVNTFVFDTPMHSSRARRRYMIAFYILAPIAGWVGTSLFWSTFDLDDLILPTLVAPRARTPSVAWGSVLVLCVGICSVMAAGVILLVAEEAAGKKPRRPSDGYRELAPGEVEHGRGPVRDEDSSDGERLSGPDEPPRMKPRGGRHRGAQSVRSV